MKLLEIEVENLFAYRGKVTVDLRGTSAEKNIVLVWGRNGRGKTSLLNAVKLLFLGASDESVRWVGFPRNKLQHRQYVLGDGSAWSGIINTEAKRHDPETRAHVRLVWQAGDLKVTAERSWTLVSTQDGYRERLIVDDGEARLVGDAAEERLASFMPRSFVPFFFFDGEDIKAMTEQAEGKKSIDFDRVLQTSFVAELAEQLTGVASERLRASLPSETRSKIIGADADRRKAEAELQAIGDRISAIEDTLIEYRAERQRLLTRQENLRSGASQAERELGERQVQQLKERLRELTEQIVKEIPKVAPLAANPSLVRAALAAVRARLAEPGAEARQLLDRIEPLLPAWLSEGPPALTMQQAEAIAESLLPRMRGLVQSGATNGPLSTIDFAKAGRLQDALLDHGQSTIRVAHIGLLRDARSCRLNLESANERLARLQVGSDATLNEYRETQAALAALDERISERDRALGQEQQRRTAELDIAKKATAEVASLEKTLARVERDAKHARFTKRVAQALNDYRERLRASVREEVERAINEKFAILVHDHQLVDRIVLDDTYTLSFVDARGAPVGRASLSSGLKQLAATALLWAMKDVARHDMPVMIDTPLGRIDRDNQRNMLENYYPKLADQVVILPTDAEIDARKLEVIRDRVAKSYVIDNPTGNRASLREGFMIEQAR